MSTRKRADQGGSVARMPKRPVHESGVMYLYQQLRELDTDKSPFTVEADDSDVTSWTVGITRAWRASWISGSVLHSSSRSSP